MARGSRSTEALPPSARRALDRLAADLRLARERRGWSLREAAARLFVSIPTLRRLEAGHPAVSVGVLAHALFLYGMAERLAWVADPSFDLKAIARDRHRHRPKREADFDV